MYRRMEHALLSVFNEDKTVVIQLSQSGMVRFNNTFVEGFCKSPLEKH